MPREFYERPMVIRLKEICGNPEKPLRFNQDQFDVAQHLLIASSRKEWHEINRDDYWAYLLDLTYVPLDQGLFDHLFPAFLIRWWEGLLDRTGGPESECDFYSAIDKGDVLNKMLGEARRQAVYEWMTDAYLEAVDAWSGQLRQWRTRFAALPPLVLPRGGAIRPYCGANS